MLNTHRALGLILRERKKGRSKRGGRKEGGKEGKHHFKYLLMNSSGEHITIYF
jgi:hypothetical protein